MLEILIATVGGLALIYVSLLVLLAVYAARHPDTVSMKDALRMLPDLLRLFRGLVSDSTLPRGVRVRVALLVVYLAIPFDIVPDFLPVLGYADDILVVALVLRSVVRRAGSEALRLHWSGSDVGLSIVQRLAGLDSVERVG